MQLVLTQYYYKDCLGGGGVGGYTRQLSHVMHTAKNKLYSCAGWSFQFMIICCNMFLLWVWTQNASIFPAMPRSIVIRSEEGVCEQKGFRHHTRNHREVVGLDHSFNSLTIASRTATVFALTSWLTLTWRHSATRRIGGRRWGPAYPLPDQGPRRSCPSDTLLSPTLWSLTGER